VEMEVKTLRLLIIRMRNHVSNCDAMRLIPFSNTFKGLSRELYLSNEFNVILIINIL